jgi:NAD(P)-dependent dehydrogenase (short-subunit alcohol dehydrogenase family)
MQNTGDSPSAAKAWIITGPTSGIGRRTALEVAVHGTVLLVGRDPNKLSEVEAEIRAQPGGRAVSIVCDFSDIPSVRRAAAQIVSLVPRGSLARRAGLPVRLSAPGALAAVPGGGRPARAAPLANFTAFRGTRPRAARRRRDGSPLVPGRLA